VPIGQPREAQNPAHRAPSRAERSAVTSSDQVSHSCWFISINSFATLMTRLSKPTRRRFLLNTGMLAAGWELFCADAVLTQELAPTPSCRDGDEPTVRQTEGPFFKPRSPERSDMREPGVGGRRFELSGFVLTRSCRPLHAAVVDLWHADEKGKYDNIGFRYLSSPGPTARSVFTPSCRRPTPAERGTITLRFKRRAAVC
jgi:hypothetical protein